MRQRTLVLAGVTAAVTVVSLGFVTAQSQSTAPKTGQAPKAIKTSWGEPDLQGIWTRDTDVPLQRPAKYAGREFFTAAEIAEIDKIRAARPLLDTRATKGTEQDVAGAYNAVFTTRRPTGLRTSLIVDPPDGRIPAVTALVQKRRADIRQFQLALLENTDTCKNKLPGCEGGTYTGKVSPRRFDQPPVYMTGRVNRNDGPEDRGLSEGCMSAQMPDFLGGAFSGGMLGIRQSPGFVSIYYDTGQGQGWHRVIPVDGSAHLPPSVRQWWGDSRGHWEGNTLVVDISNFSPQTDFQGSRENLHVVERWTRTAGDTIEYVATMDDATAWVKPWTVKMDIVKQSDEANRIYKEPRCQEGNFGMIGMLAGVRAQELAFAEGRGVDPTTTNVDTPTFSANALATEAGDEDADPLAE
jgi:hypothetical protein